MLSIQERMNQARAFPNTATVDLLNAEVEKLVTAAKLIQHHSPACKEEIRGECCCGLAQLREALR